MNDSFNSARRLRQLAELCFLLVSSGVGAADYELHPGLEMSLWAREPDVVDPVALTWDEQGRMYVVEMRDYPYGFGNNRAPGGTIRLLEDSDEKGSCDRSIVFAEGLSFPTSIVPWNGGVIVCAPPEIIYLKDTNNDGKADVREVLLKGFTLGVTDSNVNGLRWGLDNRVHGVNGGNGGAIVSTRKPAAPVELRNLDFSFDPQTGDFTTTFHTSAGFGLVFDRWGRSFVTYNINHIQQRMLPARYLERFPGMPPVEGVESISDHGAMARIFPISEPQTRVNHPEQSGHFSSAGGMGFIAGPGYRGDLPGSILVCDVVGNLVHRDVLVPHGPGFVARRSVDEQNCEFFASRDLAFRPVGVELGPDGALYLIDMQRDVIEHPDYIPQKVREQMDVRAGETRGRIYRITPKGGISARRPRLAETSAAELADYLGHPNPWWRQTAQRLLIERGDRSVVPRLKRVATAGREPVARLHALYTLHGFGALDETLLLRALTNPEPGLRENALILAETFPQARVARAVLNLAHDPNPRVRFQAALTLGHIIHPDAPEALLKILLHDHEWRWTRLAVMSSTPDDWELFEGLASDRKFWREATASKLALVRELTDLMAARASSRSENRLARALLVLQKRTADPRWHIAAVEGLNAGASRAPAKIQVDAALESALENLSNKGDPVLAAAVWKLSRALGMPPTAAQTRALAQAAQRVSDRSRTPGERVQDIQVLGLGSLELAGPALLPLLDGREPAALQKAVLEVLANFDERSVANGIMERWRELAPSLRGQAIQLMLQRLSFHDVLLSFVEAGKIQVGELSLDLEQRRRLLRDSAPEIRARAARWIADEEYSNRKAVVSEWLQKMPPEGDATRGRAMFETHCASCHKLEGIGFDVGPELTGSAYRSVEDLASNILDPNMAIPPQYATYTAETLSSEIHSGMLVAETAEAVTLLQAQGIKTVVPRSRIRRLQSTGLSLMPEGLETAMTPADLRDLIAFLQKQR